MRALRRVTVKTLAQWAAVTFVLGSIVILSRNWSSEQTPAEKGYVGNTGTFVFYRVPPRNASIEIDPETMKLCKETQMTKCNPPTRRPDSDRERDRKNRKPFKLAMLRPPPFLSGDPDFIGCDYDNCEFVGTGPQFAQDADALFVYVVGMKDKDFPLPPNRNPKTVYFMGSWEAPIFTAATFLKDANSPWNKAFNATTTYRMDSDLVYTYGMLDFQPPLPHEKPDYLAIAKRKKKTAVWIVSNCESPSNRNAYIKELKKYIDIDVYGKCGKPCKVFDEVCVPDFVDTYRFYLSFENSFCTDYITEKFFKLYIAGSHIVPVVRGGVDYNEQFPEKTFVSTADFKSPKQLAMHLKRLEADELEYSRYLEAKDRYRAVIMPNRFCQMCEYLHKNEGRTRVLPDAKKWYGDGHCWNVDDV